DFPSMGPRARARGNEPKPYQSAPCLRTFNGAASARSRKPGNHGLSRQVISPFNGAASARSRKRFVDVDEELMGQRARARGNPASPPISFCTSSRTYGAASARSRKHVFPTRTFARFKTELMGPRARARGNTPIGKHPLWRAENLWGRERALAETR